MSRCRQAILAVMVILFFWCAVASASQKPPDAPIMVSRTQFQEAADFFSRVSRQSSNPLIISMARDNVFRLRRRHTAPSADARRKIVVPLLEQPDTSLTVPLLIGNRTMGTFMVDTGASYTTITPATARQLGMSVTQQTPRIPLITPDGIVKAPVVTLKNVNIGSLRIPEVSAIVQPLRGNHNPQLSGVLGMNFFHGMDLTIREDRLEISVRRPLR